VSEIYAPVAGTVVAVNETVVASPELVNSDPYGAGWLCDISTSDAADFEALLDAEAYRALTNN
jgi:glycine cleavage system H protein